MSITIFIIIVTGLISYQSFNNPSLKNQLMHYPYQEVRDKSYYRFISSGFVHGSWLHLGINMFVLWSFGEYIEKVYVAFFGDMMGRVLYIAMYLATIVFADIPTFLKHRNNPGYRSLGASGAVSGIVFISILLSPWSLIYVYFIPVPGIVAGVAYLIYSSWASKNSQDLIDHDAHFYGALFGMLFTIALKPALFSNFIDRLVNDFPL